MRKDMYVVWYIINQQNTKWNSSSTVDRPSIPVFPPLLLGVWLLFDELPMIWIMTHDIENDLCASELGSLMI